MERRLYRKKANQVDLDVKKTIFFRQVGAKIAYYRTLRGLTQIQLAKRIGISADTLARIEQGKYNNNISLSMLLDIAEELSIDVVLLLSFTDQNKQMW